MCARLRSRIDFAATADLSSIGHCVLLLFSLLSGTQAFPMGDAAVHRSPAEPVALELTLSDVVQPVSADHIVRGIRHANEIDARAILLTIDTPGGLESSMR